MHIEIPHREPKLLALARVKRGLVDARPHMKDQVTITKEEWSGDTLNFACTLQGKEITGTLVVTDTSFIVDAKLPLLWRMFEGKIEKAIQEQAAGLLKQ
jgi:hypothetical protein